MPPYRPYLVALAIVALVASPAAAQKKYDIGVTDTEIKIGQTAPLSGPISAYAVISRTQHAYLDKINDEGGINGRKVNHILYDDAANPSKTVEQVRKLVEGDQVFLMFNPQGTPQNTAIRKYLNDKKVPQLLVGSGGSKFGDPTNFPWTIGWTPPYFIEGGIYAKYILQNKPDAHVAVLFENNDYGKEMLAGFERGLGDKASSLVVAKEAYELGEPVIDSRIIKLKASGADVLITFSTPKYTVQSIKKMRELNWRPLHILTSVTNSIGTVLSVAGLEDSVGIISAGYYKDSTDSAWAEDPAVVALNRFVDKYMPGTPKTDLMANGYNVVQLLVEILRRCGDDLTRENVMRQATNLKDFELPMFLPGIKINTSASDYYPVESMQMLQFDGKRWAPIGSVIDSHFEN
jgi:branched-chain amino acid transport system substrate-binding protein